MIWWTGIIYAMLTPYWGGNWRKIMKIEIGESLMQSYLRYEKGCLLTQTNWKTSSSWNIENGDFEKIEYIFNKIQIHSDFSDIFKKNSLEQALKQAELDVVGIDKNKLYLIEVAFHENGLQYGGRLDTKDRVCKKLLRAYLIGLAYFPNYTYEIIFASPKVNPATDETIRDYFSVLNRDFSDNEKVAFKYIANEEFKNTILIPTLKSSSEDADTSELFIRSAKLLDIFGLIKFSENNESLIQNSFIEESISKIDEISIPSQTVHVQYNYSMDTVIEFIPQNEIQFKQLLLQKKRAKRTWIYKDGRSRTEIWDAHNFKISSNLKGNIQSTTHWRSRKETGLIKVILEII